MKPVVTKLEVIDETPAVKEFQNIHRNDIDKDLEKHDHNEEGSVVLRLVRTNTVALQNQGQRVSPHCSGTLRPLPHDSEIARKGPLPSDTSLPYSPAP